MLDAKPDAIVMVGPYTPLAAFIKEAHAAGLKAQLATVSFVGTDNLVTEVGKDGDGVVISQVVPFPQDNDLAVTRECREAISKHNGEALGFVNFEGCLTARVMATALERAGKDVSRKTLVSSLQGMKGADVGGMTAAFTAENHQAFDKVFMTQIQGGKIVKMQ
jgi:ABC-type branched-subunit amino acid transport system substrate-binding protein